MASLADQEATRRQHVETQLSHTAMEREQMRSLTQTLMREKQEIENQRSQLSTALSETQSECKKLKDTVKVQKEKIEMHQKQIQEVKSALQSQEVAEKIDIQKILSTLDPSIQPIVISPSKIKMNSRAPSITVKRQTSAAVTSLGEKNPEITPVASEDSVSDQLAKLKEENAKLKTKLKKEEESRKHW